MSSSVHVENNKQDILILGEGCTQGLDGTAFTVEKKCYLLMVQKLLNLKQKVLKL